MMKRAGSPKLGLWYLPLALCVPVGVALSACSAAGGGSDGPAVAGEGSGGSGSGSGGTNSQMPGAGASGNPEEPGEPTARCDVSRTGGPDLRRLSRFELERSLTDIFPMVAGGWTSTLSPDTVSPAGFDNDSTMLVVSRQSARELSDTAESLAAAVSGTALASILPCATSTPDAACAGQFIDSYGRRFFRRPLSETERAQYLDFWSTAFTATNDFAKSIGWIARGFVESPLFLYRREVGDTQGDARQLDQFEIATELAYTFTASTPSDALLDRAAQGELTSPEALVAAAQELLATARGSEVVQHFFDAFVGYGRVTTIAKTNDPQAFEVVRGDMAEETRRFIEEVVATRGGGLRELLTASFTVPSQAAAIFYGFPDPASDYTVTERPAGRGIGLLAQGAFLATYAQPNGSSPTKRGQWIYQKLLCQTIPPVPAAIPDLKPPRAGITTRQRYEEEHAADAYCASCHSRWDPIGFGFEHFDEMGKYREMEGALPIDTVSYVPDGPAVEGNAPSYFDFTTQEELASGLAELPLVSECVSGSMATFAFGEALTCAGETRRQDFIDGNIGFIEYLASLAGEPHFTQRNNDE